MRPSFARVAVLALALCSCSERPQGRTVPIRSARLIAAGTCADVEAAVKAAAIARMNAALDATLEAALRGCSWSGGPWTPGVPGSSPMPPGAPDMGEDSGGPAARSGTNEQVPGVDEPDIVKSDGAYLYVIADGRL